MKRNVSRIFKNEDVVEVYQVKNNPDVVYKTYNYVTDSIETIDELKQKREKLLAMKKRKEWPQFLIRPNCIEKMNKYCFTAGFPYVEGIDLLTYMRNNEIDINTLANLLKLFEKKIYSEKDFVFPDLSNPQNILILSNSINNELNFMLIDPDDVQFDGYGPQKQSSLVFPTYPRKGNIYGYQKCINEDMFNKELDIRSMYSLLYYILNGKDYFLPPLFEREGLSEYEEVLKSFNIPESSNLYKKSMNILDDRIQNEAIDGSLYELINEGYQLEIYNKNSYGYQYRLMKK